jgi:regulator of protease activity HflC (stomatin/prohibitin superfamily)
VFALRTGEQGDTAMLFGSISILCGLLVWVSLIVVFHQHKLERLEALEEDELAAMRPGGKTSVFEAERGATGVAARRLELMHKWLMPAVSVLLAAVLALLGWWMAIRMGTYSAAVTDATQAAEFARTPALGWAVAICLAFAAASFIFSRFVAGMSQQPAWRNLRGGAAYMVGNALVLSAIAAGVVFRFFQNDAVIQGVAWAVPVFLFVMALEIGLNLVLGFYRPRIPGETPRPAFDSRILSILAAPDTLVRSINEAVNYQFGFDVTSTWGYQLLMRSVAKLLGIGAAVMLLLSTMVVVEPHQQAVRLTGGRLAEERVHDSGLLLKWPWPFQTASVHDVTRIRSLPLTAVRTPRALESGVNIWTSDLKGKTDREIEPFLVRRSRLDAAQLDPDLMPGRPGPARPDAEARIGADFSLLDAEIVLQYRIRRGGQGLLQYLRFASDARARRDPLTARERTLQALALREASRYFATQTLDEALARRRSAIADTLQQRIQAAFETAGAGVEVVGVNVTNLRPSGTAAGFFEDLMMARQDLTKVAADAQRTRENSMAYFIGDGVDPALVLAEIDRYRQLRARAARPDDPEVVALRDRIEELLKAGGGNAGQQIALAEADRWLKLMATRADAARVQGELAVYRAAPDVYRQREIMRVLKAALPERRKFLIGIDPSRVRMNVKVKDLDTTFLFDPKAQESK